MFDNLSKFKSLLEEKELLINKKLSKIKKYDEFLKCQRDKILSRVPHKQKKNWDSIPAMVELNNRTKIISNKFFNFWDIKIKKIEDQLVELATLSPNLKIPISESPILWDTIYSSTYSSQGFGASKYALNAASKLMDKAIFYKLKTEVRASTNIYKDDKWGIEYKDFEIWVWTDKIGLEILKRKPENAFR